MKEEKKPLFELQVLLNSSSGSESLWSHWVIPVVKHGYISNNTFVRLRFMLKDSISFKVTGI